MKLKNFITLVTAIGCFGAMELGAKSIDISITKDSEDAEQFIKKTKVYMSSTDLELGEDKGNRQLVGLRFKHVYIPKNAKVINAYIQFTVDEISTEDTALTIYGEKETYSNTFTRQTIINRKKTNANVEWYPEPWVEVGSHGENQRTPDLSAIIEELRSQSKWKNTVGIIIKGTGKRTAESYSGNKRKAPKLHIEYIDDEPKPLKHNSIGNFVWNDSNRNGIQDNGEKGIDNITVMLLKQSNKEVLSTTTTKNGGKYLFTNIDDGVYYIKVNKKNYSVTKKEATKNTKDSNAYSNGRTRRIYISRNKYDNTVDIGLYNKSTSWCDDSKYVCVTNAHELTYAVSNATASDTIILKEGKYKVHHLEIKVPHVTIASQYYLDKDKKHIKKTILKDSDLQRSNDKLNEEWLIDGGKGDSEYLSVIGLTIEHAKKGIGFHKGHGLVDHCHVDTIRGTDAISFENVLNGGGEVRYSSTYSSDEGVDLDTAKGNGKGIFKIHHNYFKGNKDKGDDLIEMRIMTKGGRYEVDIHDNIFDSAHGNAMQFIDYGAKDKQYLNKTTIKIHHNIIKNSNYSGIDTTLDEKTARVHESSDLAERISIYNNYFYNNKHHIDGGLNMHIKNNIFSGARKTDNALAWVKGKSTIKDNIFFENNNNYYESNGGKNTIHAKNIDEITDFEKENGIKIEDIDEIIDFAKENGIKIK